MQTLGNSPGRYIPAILQVASNNDADMFIIFMHGNACDAGQAGECAKRESPYFNAHYLVVEYPGYGLADGFSTQSLIEAVLYSVYAFVVNDLKVDPSKIVIIGRSVGTGIAAFLSAKLQSLTCNLRLWCSTRPTQTSEMLPGTYWAACPLQFSLTAGVLGTSYVIR